MKKQMFVFGTALLLLCSGSESERHEFVRKGDTAVLLCENVQPGQERCNGTTWNIISVKPPRISLELIRLGQIGSKVPEQLSERLNVTGNCSLQIKDVHSDDAGRYFCQQYNSSTGPTVVPGAAVTLSVVSVTEEEEEKNDFLELQCCVSTPLEFSSIKVKWLIQGREVDKDNSEIKPVSLRGGLKINIKKSHYAYKNKHLLKCAVTHGDQTHQFCRTTECKERTTERPSTTKKKDDEGEEQSGGGSSGLEAWSWAVVAAAAVVLLLVALALVVWRKRRVKHQDTSVVSGGHDSTGPQGERGETGPAAEPEEVNYASINFHDSHRTEVRGGEEAVTYSSVRNQAPDSTQLYANVNKPNQKHI